VPSAHYAIRGRPDGDLQRIIIIEPVRGGKWRAGWIEPNPGLRRLREVVRHLRRVIQRRAFLRDERNALKPADSVERSGAPGDEHTLTSAVEQVLAATDERTVYLHQGRAGLRARRRLAAWAVAELVGSRCAQPDARPTAGPFGYPRVPDVSQIPSRYTWPIQPI
jgi:hypothetical protein